MATLIVVTALKPFYNGSDLVNTGDSASVVTTLVPHLVANGNITDPGLPSLLTDPTHPLPSRVFVPIAPHISLNDTQLAAAYHITKPAGATALMLQAHGQNVWLMFVNGLQETLPASGGPGYPIAAGAPPAILDIAPGVEVYVIRDQAGAVFECDWGVQ